MAQQLNYRFGSGTIQRTKTGTQYQGTMPFEDREEVVVMSKSDLELLLTKGMVSLLMNRMQMDPMFFDSEAEENNDCDTCVRVPDEIQYQTAKGHKQKLFLDRHFYTLNPDLAIWTRWISVDESEKEKEGQVGGKGE